VTCQDKFDALPDIIMRRIPTADGGPPLYTLGNENYMKLTYVVLCSNYTPLLGTQN